MLAVLRLAACGIDAAYDCDREEVVRVLEAAGGVCKKDPKKGWEEAEEEKTKCK